MVNYNKQFKKIEASNAKYEKLSQEFNDLKAKYTRIQQALDGTLHEIRRFSNEISHYSEILSVAVQGSNPRYEELCKNILITSTMISSRLAFTDLELNPASVSLQPRIRSGIYKKFEKASHILKQNALSKQVSIKFIGNSFKEIETLPAFELVPFVIIENAIKYSPRNQEITVSFEESLDKRSLLVSVKSIGPVLEHDEFSSSLERGVRGKNTRLLSVAGEGLGLFLVKFLCDYHDILLKLSSVQVPTYHLEKVPYSDFCISLNFKN